MKTKSVLWSLLLLVIACSCKQEEDAFSPRSQSIPSTARVASSSGFSPVVENGVYIIYHQYYGDLSRLVLDVPGGRTEDGVIIQQFLLHGGPNQQWRLTHVGNGYYTIVNVQSGKALDVPGGSPTPGMKIQQYTSHGGPNQQWRFVSYPAVTGPDLFRPPYHRIYNRQTGLALDVPNGSVKSGEQIQQYTPHSGWNQTWLLRRVQ